MAITLQEFKDKVKEYETNNISAFMGKIQITEMEKTDLLDLYTQLPKTDQPDAKKLLQSKGIDVP